MSLADLNLDQLAKTDEEVAALTRPERDTRVLALMREARQILSYAIRTEISEQNKGLAAIVLLYSGGNDSTVLAHLFKGIATHAAHANTGVGVEQTREFVRATCAQWGLPLLERSAPREIDSYRAMVLAHGFPGPGHHYKMFQRLKERAIWQIRREVINGRSRTHRMVLLAGRRRQESNRRATIPELERDGSAVWVSPLVNWTKLDLNTYRLMRADQGDAVPVNEVSDLIHMSGECLCGAYAHKGERDEIEQWFPQAFYDIAELERLIADRTDIPDHQKVWGWGWNKKITRTPKVGRLCSSCDARHEEAMHG